MRARVADDRVIQEIRSDRVDLAMLVGARGGGHLRRILDAHIHAERIQGTPLYLLLARPIREWTWRGWQE